MIIDETLVRQVIKKRSSCSHKGNYGRVLLIGGLYPYGGSIIMSALATVNSGAGLVTVATDSNNIISLHNHLLEAMAFDYGDTDLLKKNITTSDVILIGPGLGESSVSETIFQMVLDNISERQTLIIDGSALNLLAKDQSVLFKTNRLILTPHQKEWERLSGIAISNQTVATSKIALQAFPSSTILVAKSHQTKVIQGDKVASLPLGGPYQAIGGMGDTLCGMVAGFVAQFKENLFDSVSASVYLHSYIAEQLSEQSYVVLPTRISSQIPQAMKRFSQN